MTTQLCSTIKYSISLILALLVSAVWSRAIQHRLDRRCCSRREWRHDCRSDLTMTNVGTNDNKTVQANREGYYEALVTPDRHLQNRGQRDGFQDTTLNEVRLAVGNRLRADVQLGVGAVSA